MVRPFLDAFWNKAFWLPSNVTWEDLQPSPDKAVTYTDYRDILLSIPMGLVFTLLRFILDEYLYAPLGKAIGVKNGKNKKASLNPKLEVAYKANPASNKVYEIAKQLDMSERQVARWWRLRMAQDKPSTLAKFCDSAWRFTFFLYNFSYGVFAVWNKDWLWDVNQCFIGYPHQGITHDVRWYYIVATAFYWSLTFTVFWDVRRKDFCQMVIHHLATLALLSFSWVCNFHRIGTLFMLSHDGVEALLEMTKAAKCAGYQKFCVYTFAMFTFLWIVSKLWIYPFYIIWSLSLRAPLYMGVFPSYYMMVTLSYLLMVLNIFWTWLILQMAYRSIKAGQVSENELNKLFHIARMDNKDTYCTPDARLPVGKLIIIIQENTFFGKTRIKELLIDKQCHANEIDEGIRHEKRTRQNGIN